MLPEYVTLGDDQEILPSTRNPERLLTIRDYLAEIIGSADMTPLERDAIHYRCGLTDDEWHTTDETIEHLGGAMTIEALSTAEKKVFSDTPHVGRLLRNASLYLECAQWRVTPREDKLLRYLWGLTDGQPHTYEETAERFGVTPERVRQIQALSLRLSGRRASYSRRLKDYLA